jgi:hypothetical protein
VEDSFYLKYIIGFLDGRIPKQPVSNRPVMKFKKPNLANTPEIEAASFKTAKIHNAYIQNAQCQKT